MDPVHRFEGTFNQVLGDGIMALFGAPVAHEDHAARACYAALAMQDALHRYAEEVRRRDGLAVQIRVGLNSGDVVVRAIGNDLHMDYSAIWPDHPPRGSHGTAGVARPVFCCHRPRPGVWWTASSMCGGLGPLQVIKGT